MKKPVSLTIEQMQSLFPAITLTESVTQVAAPKSYENVSVEGNQKVVKTGQNLWGLRAKNWNLKKAAGDYYILHLAALVDEDKFQPYLNRHTDILMDQFIRYTDMAIGGEFRHCRVRNGLPKRLKESLQDNTVQGSRNSAWEGWFWFRQRYGTVALKWIRDAFNDKQGRWGSGYGGTSWGTIADTLYQFEIGNITRQTFVDTCWGLQHNGGVYFNKWWEVSYLYQVLDANQQGIYCVLHHNFTSAMVKRLTEKVVKESCMCPTCSKS